VGADRCPFDLHGVSDPPTKLTFSVVVP
jgi:hypothetical protein